MLPPAVLVTRPPTDSNAQSNLNKRNLRSYCDAAIREGFKSSVLAASPGPVGPV